MMLSVNLTDMLHVALLSTCDVSNETACLQAEVLQQELQEAAEPASSTRAASSHINFWSDFEARSANPKEEVCSGAASLLHPHCGRQRLVNTACIDAVRRWRLKQCTAEMNARWSSMVCRCGRK
jgi:hypothetical protein